MATLSLPTNTPTLDGAVVGCTTDDTTGTVYAMVRTDRQWYSVANGDSPANSEADKAVIIAQDITASELVWAGIDADLATIQLTIDGLAARLDPANPYYVGWAQEPKVEYASDYYLTTDVFTLTRDSRQSSVDFEGLTKSVSADRAAHVKARTVDNICAFPVDFTTGSGGWTAGSNNADAGNGKNISFTTSFESRIYLDVRDLNIPAGASIRMSVDFTAADAGKKVRFTTHTGSWANSPDLVIPGTGQRISYLWDGTPGDLGYIGVMREVNSPGVYDVTVKTGMLVEVVTGQANKNPSAFIEGSAQYDYENTNTVDGSYLVTEGAQGTAITGMEGLLLEGARTNLLVDPAAPATQGITVTAVEHALSMVGAGSVTLSGVGSGTATAAAPLVFTPTAGTLTVTPSGDVSKFQCEVGGFASGWVDGARTTPKTIATVTDLGLPDTLVNNVSGQIKLRMSQDYTQKRDGYDVLLELYASGGNWMQIRVQPTNDYITLRKQSGSAEGSAQTTANTVQWTKGELLDIRWKQSSEGLYLNVSGSIKTAATDNSKADFQDPLVSCSLGSTTGGNTGSFCTIQEQTIWPYALTDEELEALT